MLLAIAGVFIGGILAPIVMRASNKQSRLFWVVAGATCGGMVSEIIRSII